MLSDAKIMKVATRLARDENLRGLCALVEQEWGQFGGRSILRDDALYDVIKMLTHKVHMIKNHKHMCMKNHMDGIKIGQLGNGYEIRNIRMSKNNCVDAITAKIRKTRDANQ